MKKVRVENLRVKPKSVAAQLRLMRRRAGISQLKAGMRAGISQQQVSKLEQGDISLSACAVLSLMYGLQEIGGNDE